MTGPSCHECSQITHLAETLLYVLHVHHYTILENFSIFTAETSLDVNKRLLDGLKFSSISLPVGHPLDLQHQGRQGRYQAKKLGTLDTLNLSSNTNGLVSAV